MMTLIKMAFIFLGLQTVFSLHPVKVSMMLFFSSSTIFFLMFYSTGLVWIPTLFYMLFLGGILILFMILSSIAPNEKSKKMKKMHIFILLISSLALIMSMEEKLNMDMTPIMMKLFMYNSQNLLLMTSLVTLYFFMFLKIISMEKSTMRTQLCYYMKNFVNF